MRTLCCLLIVCLAVAAARGSAPRLEAPDDTRIWQEISALKEKQAMQDKKMYEIETRQDLQDLKIDGAGSRGLNFAAFSVALRGGNVNVASGSKAPYNTVITNVGNGYSTASHEFTAPTTGTYVFSVTLYSPNTDNTCTMRLTHNNEEVVESVGTNRSSHQRMGTNLVVLELTSGDIVTVKATSTCTMDGTQYRSSFSGFQI